MTVQKPSLRPSGGRLTVRSFHFISSSSLSSGPRVQERRRAHQVIGNHAEPDPPSGAVRASIATAPQAMAPFDDADAAFAADAPPLPAAEPSLSFVRPSRRSLAARSRQDDPSHPALRRGLFVLWPRQIRDRPPQCPGDDQTSRYGDRGWASTTSYRAAVGRAPGTQ
jgi:hypothetical protein